MIAGIKTVSDTRIGDTITLDSRPAPAPLPGFKEVKPVVFSSLYPISSEDYETMVVALEKYKLNDAALIYQKRLLRSPGTGLSMWFPWPAPSRNRSGAPRTRV
jgi:GTP-binding protein LepA